MQRKRITKVSKIKLFLLHFIIILCALCNSLPVLAGKHCGAEGDWRNSLIPDKWPPPETRKYVHSTLGKVKTVSISRACAQHDACYDSKGVTQEMCDEQFLADMTKECDRVYSSLVELPVREACHLASQGYYKAVREYGEEAFIVAQKKAHPSSGKTSNSNQETGALGQVRQGGLLFSNSDFEMGDLTNWRAQGEAFTYQPTKGDNIAARSRKQVSLHKGEYWVGTYEKYRGNGGEKAGGKQGDKPMGSLTSVSFVVQENQICFLIGGGRREKELFASLVVDGKMVKKTTGRNAEKMQRVTWDVSEYVGKAAHILVEDNSSGGWGHLNVDDFRYVTR